MTSSLVDSANRHGRRRIDRAITVAITSAAVGVIAIAIAILVFIGKAGVTGFIQGGGLHMLFDRRWSPDRDPAHFGFIPFLVGTGITAAGGVLLGAVPAVLAAAYLSEFAAPRTRLAFQRLMEVAAALPSVVFGYVAVTWLIPRFANPHTGCQGLGVAPATIVLAFMIAPTVALLALNAFRRTPDGLRDASAALGVSRWHTTWHAVLPTVWRGVIVAVFFGFARAAGETMAVQMVAGNGQFAPIAALRPSDAHVAVSACPTFAGIELFRPMSTISTRIIMDMPETQPGTPWNNALFSMSLLLLILSTGVVLTTRWLSRRTVS